MPALSTLEITAVASVMLVVLIAKLSRTETRTLLAALVVVAMVPTPAAVVAVGVFSLVLKLVDVVKLD